MAKRYIDRLYSPKSARLMDANDIIEYRTEEDSEKAREREGGCLSLGNYLIRLMDANDIETLHRKIAKKQGS